MLLQTNSYIVPKDKRAEHARLLRRFRAALAKLGCDSFEVYEQVGSNWSTGEPTGRYVQIMRFRDRRHQLAVQAAERSDSAAQAIIAEFCQLINFPYQQQQGLFAVGFYNSVLPVAPTRPQPGDAAAAGAAVAGAAAVADDAAAVEGAQEEAPADAGGDQSAQYEAVSDEAVSDEAVSDEGESNEVLELDSAAESVAETESDGGQDLAAPDQPEAESVVEEAPPAEEHPAEAVAEDAGEGAGSEPVSEEPSAEEAAPQENDPDELGALLDAHLHATPGDEANGDEAHPLAGPEGNADEAPEGLDAMDIGDLEIMPDEPAPEARHASNHAAR